MSLELSKQDLTEIEQALELERKVRQINERNWEKTELHERILEEME